MLKMDIVAAIMEQNGGYIKPLDAIKKQFNAH